MRYSYIYRCIYTSLLAVFLVLTVQISAHNVFAVTTHIVISEIQVGTTHDATDEFVELYNPSDVTQDLAKWRLRKRTTGGIESNLIASLSGTLEPHAYLLISHQNYSGTLQSDHNYSTSNSIAPSNTVLLQDKFKLNVDRVGLGQESSNPETNGAPELANDGSSIERKAHEMSTSESMTTGVDVLKGNSEDTDNNAQDFVTRTIPDPQNSLSTREPNEPTPIPTALPTSTPTPSITPTATPTQTPTSNTKLPKL